MTLDDYDSFCAVVVGFAELRGRQLSAEAIELYWHAMQSWSLDDFKRGANALLNSSKFMPTPYDFEQLRRAGELKPPEAWVLVLSGAALDPNSRIYRAAQCVGGQYAVRHANTERDLPHVERRFLEAYAQLSEVEPIREALPQIAKPAARVSLRRPTAIANCLPAEVMRAQPAIAPVAALPAPPVTKPEPRIAASVKVEKLARSMPTLTDDELSRIACEPVDVVRQVRAALETAA